jgi:2-keto-4-pentenoate hydratase/2-oxohepta-3-ene-1,7-dioic acid hydratase in catechol pathway
MKLARVLWREQTVSVEVTEQGYRLPQSARGEHIATEEAVLLPPAQPTKILAVGWNFTEHVREMVERLPERHVPQRSSELIIFLKPPSSLIGHGDDIVYPAQATKVEFEGELVAIIGKPLRRAGREEVRDGILGWTCGNDITERDLQRRDKQWWRAKGFDTFAPVGPYIETRPPAEDDAIRTFVNGELRQEGRVGDMVRDPLTLIAEMSQVMTLLPGDLVMLGTPPGVGQLAPGDVVEVRIDGVGALKNRVIAETAQ